MCSFQLLPLALNLACNKGRITLKEPEGYIPIKVVIDILKSQFDERWLSIEMQPGYGQFKPRAETGIPREHKCLPREEVDAKAISL
jgi:hypothetical protein